MYRLYYRIMTDRDGSRSVLSFFLIVPEHTSDFSAKVSISWPIPGAEFEVFADI
jgi:hypothetical protein